MESFTLIKGEDAEKLAIKPIPAVGRYGGQISINGATII
jgi:hypothetical protein